MEVRRCEGTGVRFENCRAGGSVYKDIYIYISVEYIVTNYLNESEMSEVVYDSRTRKKNSKKDCHGRGELELWV